MTPCLSEMRGWMSDAKQTCALAVLQNLRNDTSFSRMCLCCKSIRCMCYKTMRCMCCETTRCMCCKTMSGHVCLCCKTIRCMCYKTMRCMCCETTRFMCCKTMSGQPIKERMSCNSERVLVPRSLTECIVAERKCIADKHAIPPPSNPTETVTGGTCCLAPPPTSRNRHT
jgi:hypothetical protein